MKNNILPYSLIMCLISLNNLAQKNENLLNQKNIDEDVDSIAMDMTNYPHNKKIKYYHVEEIVPMKFGGRKTVYDVSDQQNIRTYDLGPKSKRIVTPVFAEGEETEASSIKSDTILKIENAKLFASEMSKSIDTSAAFREVIKTYEKVEGKGYESIDILKVIGNHYFFNNEFLKAEKCYSKLFSKTEDLEPSYYYHYAVTLKALGKIEKSDEYYKKFRHLTINNSR